MLAAGQRPCAQSPAQSCGQRSPRPWGSRRRGTRGSALRRPLPCEQAAAHQQQGIESSNPQVQLTPAWLCHPQSLLPSPCCAANHRACRPHLQHPFHPAPQWCSKPKLPDSSDPTEPELSGRWPELGWELEWEPGPIPPSAAQRPSWALLQQVLWSSPVLALQVGTADYSALPEYICGSQQGVWTCPHRLPPTCPCCPGPSCTPPKRALDRHTYPPSLSSNRGPREQSHRPTCPWQAQHHSPVWLGFWA